MLDKISVVVPVYNVEDYLEKCLDSILQQTYQNFEVILVNDGSSDASLEICEAYIRKDSRFKVYSKPNGGLSSARNYGLDRISGNYLTFIDSDDWVEPNYLMLMLNKMLETESDIVVTSFYDFKESEGTFYFYIFENDYYEKSYNRKSIFEEGDIFSSRFFQNIAFTTLWGKLYKTSVFKNIRCPENRDIDDMTTIYKLYLNSNKIVYINTALYVYRRRDNGLSSTFKSEQALFDWVEAQEERITLLSCFGIDISQFLDEYQKALGILEHNARIDGLGDTQAYKRIREKLELLKQSKLN